MKPILKTDSDYLVLFETLKTDVQHSQTRVAFGVAREVMLLYWRIGQSIDTALQQKNWGQALLEQLALDFKKNFPDIEGFSKRNLYRMRSFFMAYPMQNEFVT